MSAWVCVCVCPLAVRRWCPNLVSRCKTGACARGARAGTPGGYVFLLLCFACCAFCDFSCCAPLRRARGAGKEEEEEACGVGRGTEKEEGEAGALLRSFNCWHICFPPLLAPLRPRSATPNPPSLLHFPMFSRCFCVSASLSPSPLAHHLHTILAPPSVCAAAGIAAPLNVQPGQSHRVSTQAKTKKKKESKRGRAKGRVSSSFWSLHLVEPRFGLRRPPPLLVKVVLQAARQDVARLQSSAGFRGGSLRC